MINSMYLFKCFLKALILCFLLVSISCNVNQINDVPTVQKCVNNPEIYASVEELDAVTNANSDNIYWKTARVFALMQLESYRTENDWHNAVLSKTPIIIYDSRSMPKYYEYRVIRNNITIGAITCVARKKEGGPVACVMPVAKDYQGLQLKGAGYNIYDNGYPSVLYGRLTKSGNEPVDVVDDTGDSAQLNNDIWLQMENTPEIFTNEQVSIDMVRQRAYDMKCSNTALWNTLSNILTNLDIIATNDSGMAELFGQLLTMTRAKDFEGGRVVDNFTGLKNQGWWDVGWVVRNLDWYNDCAFRVKNIIWCVPSSAAIYLSYYGYTNSIRHYVISYNTNVVNNTLTEYNIQNHQSGIFISTAGNVNITIKYSNTGGSLCITNFKVNSISGSGLTVLSSNYYISNNIAILDMNVNIAYSYINISSDISMIFQDLNKKYGNLKVTGQVNSYISQLQDNRINYTISTVEQHGYSNLCKALFVSDEALNKGEAGAGKDGFTNAIYQFSGGHITMEFYQADDWWWGDGSWWVQTFGGGTYDKMKACVDNNDIAGSGRPGHGRVALGYKERDIYQTVDVYNWVLTGYAWFIPLYTYMKTGTAQQWIGKDHFILVTDNGAEQGAGYSGREFLANINAQYSSPLFWENVKTVGYYLTELSYKKR